MTARQPRTATDDTTTDTPSAIVTSHAPRPGKVVFTERDNCDGWIASTHVVDLEP